MSIVSEIFSQNLKQDHRCDERGAVIILDDYSTVRDAPENREAYKERDRGWSVACSVCGCSQFHMDLHG